MNPRAKRDARRESLWWLSLGCVSALCLALCGQSPLARADVADVAAVASASMASAEPAVAAPSMVRFTHGLSAGVDGQAVPESDRPPGAFPDDNGPSPAVFPTQELTIRFNHQRHVKDLKLPCTSCHEKARTSHSGADSLLPKGTRCDTCHGSDHRNPMRVRADPNDPMGQCALLSPRLQ
ncbi:MAG: cytochrome c3 family protein [Pseudomonadota bacterium]